MKVHEILTMLSPAINKLLDANINPKDVQYLELYKEYNYLKMDGQKTEWIVVHLSNKYNVSRRSIFSIISKFQSEVV